MKQWMLCVALLLAGCGNQSTKLEKIAPLVVKNADVPLFSVPAAEGHWSVSSGIEKNLTNGFVYVRGAFPDQTGIPHSISMELGSIERWPQSLAEVLTLFKSGNAKPYLDKSLDSLTPARVEEFGIKRFGGEAIIFKGFSCVDTWSEKSVGPHTHGGQGMALYSSSINCPLVVNGHVYQLSLWTTTYIGAWYYSAKENYEKTKKPGDPEFPPTFEDAMKRVGGDAYLPNIGPTIAKLFSGIQFYGKVSQNYADIANPELLQEKIDHPEPYQVPVRKKR